jgi:hypothetical protein
VVAAPAGVNPESGVFRWVEDHPCADCEEPSAAAFEVCSLKIAMKAARGLAGIRCGMALAVLRQLSVPIINCRC